MIEPLTFWTLDADHNLVPTQDPIVWGRFFEDFNKRKVAYDELKKVRISTVFLGTDHNFGAYGPPLVFETMVFPMNDKRRPFRALDMDRYATWSEAVAGHADMVARWRRKEAVK